VTSDERAGRRITFGLAWLAGVPPVILLGWFFAAGEPVLKATVITHGVVPVVMAVLLVKGRRWVRTLIVAGFGLNALAALVQLMRLDWTLTTLLLLSSAAVIHGLAAVVLAASPQVRAFFAFQNRIASLDLSGPTLP
jgi:hypothetical protein